ncbi:MAG: helix-turn-helix domain-containing protein [Chryseolinea sp.]
MRTVIPLFLFSLAHLTASSQDRTFENSARGQKANLEKDTTESIKLNKLSDKYKYVDFYLSLSYAEQALKKSKAAGYHKGIALANYHKAHSYWALGYNELSIEKALIAVKISQDNNLKEIAAEAFRVLSISYRDQKEINKATLFIKRAETLALEIQNWDLLSRIYNTAGIVERDKDKNDTSLFLLKKALAITETHGTSKFQICQITSNMGECRLWENPEEGLRYFMQALALAKEFGNKQAEAGIQCDIGRALTLLKRFPQANQYLQEGLRQSRSLGLKRVTRHAYSALSYLKESEGNLAESFAYMKNYYDVRDSLLNSAKTRQIVELETRYENEKRVQTIRLLQQERRIENIWRNILIAGIILLAVLSILIYKIQRGREKKDRAILNLQIDTLTYQNKELSTKYKTTLTGFDQIPVESQDQRLLKKAIAIIEQNIGNSGFSVEKMSDEMGMSRTNMHRKIKAVTGFPPSELIRNIRLRKAALLLKNKADTVSQISFAVGFDDQSYFSKAFKKQFGVTPSEYDQSQNVKG